MTKSNGTDAKQPIDLQGDASRVLVNLNDDKDSYHHFHFVPAIHADQGSGSGSHEYYRDFENGALKAVSSKAQFLLLVSIYHPN